MKEEEDGGVIVISAELWGGKGRGGGREHRHFWARLGGMRNRPFGEIMLFVIAHYLNKLGLIFFAGKKL